MLLAIRELKIITFRSCKLLIEKSILSTTIVSLVLSLLLVGIFILSFWNLIPAITWPRLIFGGFYDSFLNMVWTFLISSLFFFLYPPVCTLVCGFFLDKVVEKAFNKTSKEKVDFYESNQFSGIFAGVKILIYSSLIFFAILILKLFFLSSTIVVLFIQFLANSYIIGKEYYEIVANKFFEKKEIGSFRRKNFLKIFFVGILSNIIFLIPILNLIAPIKVTIFMTLQISFLKNNLKC